MSVLELKNVTKAFGGVRAVDGIGLGFDPQKITALIGPNGAGKTTVFNLISGLIRPDGGTIHYRGMNITYFEPWKIARRGIGRVFQDIRLFNNMTVQDNVLTAFKNQAGESTLRSLAMCWQVKAEEKEHTERALMLLEMVGLVAKANDRAENLSYGQQKLLAIARLLAADADVLLLDEPTAGVNASMVRVLLNTVRRLSELGKTVVVIEHNMSVVIEIADWLYFLDRGRVASFGLPNDVLGDVTVRRAYIGI